MPKKCHIDWALKFLMKICHVLTLRTNTINKIITLCILIINKFHHNRMLILITTRKSLPLVSDKVLPHLRHVLNICQVLINIRQVLSEILRNSPERLPLLCSTEECDQLEQLHTFLEVFFNATVQLSCSYILSAHQLLHANQTNQPSSSNPRNIRY
jgi:hypothetical protein